MENDLVDLDAYMSSRHGVMENALHLVCISRLRLPISPFWWAKYAKWIRENCDGEWMWTWTDKLVNDDGDYTAYSGVNFYFRNVEDAVLFRLRF